MIVNNEIPQYPKQVHIEITTACSLSCFFCPIKAVRRNRGTPLTDDEIIGLIHQAADLQVDYIDFVNYGETLLHPKWFEFVILANVLMGTGKVGMVTNCTTMNDELVKQFVASSFCLLMFSVDGFSKECFESVRVGADRDKVYKNVEHYLNFLAEREIPGRTPVVAMTVCEKNEQDVSAFSNYWRKRRVTTKVYRCTGRGGEKPFTKPNANPCAVILDGLWVLNDGRVTVCCEDWQGRYVVGNIRKDSLRDIWNNDAFWAFRKAHLERRKRDIPLCRDCQTSADIPAHNMYRREKCPNAA